MISTCEGVHNTWQMIPHGGDYYSLEQNLKGEREEIPQGGCNLLDTGIFRLGILPRIGPRV